MIEKQKKQTRFVHRIYVGFFLAPFTGFDRSANFDPLPVDPRLKKKVWPVILIDMFSFLGHVSDGSVQ